MQLKINQDWGWRNFSNNEDAIGIRAFPHLVEGEGFFLCGFTKGKSIEVQQPFQPLNRTSSKQKNVSAPHELSNYIQENDDLIWKGAYEKWWCMPRHVYEFYHEIEKIIRVKKAGCFAGEFINKKFAPSQDLALSKLLDHRFPRCELSDNEALRFLRGEALQDAVAPKGLLLCQYRGLASGWGKNIGSRINNLLPKEWRLRKTS